jgi:peptidylprolyl isomerase
MTHAKLGDRVQVQYLGLRADGKAVGSPRSRKVLEFIVGSDEVIPGISFGVVGMAEGQERRLSLSPEQAYGKVRSKLIQEVPRGRIPADVALRIGQRLRAVGIRSGRRRRVRVVEVRPDTVLVDGNHPLAGEAMEVELQLISLTPSSEHPSQSEYH